MSVKPVISVSIDPDVLKWVDDEVEGKRFASRSHAIEYCLYKMMIGESNESPHEAFVTA